MTLGTQTQPRGKLLDYKEFIEHQLGRARARIKYTDLITACLTLLTAAVLLLLVEVVLDHVFGLPVLVRQIILVVGLTGGLVFAFLKILPPLLLSVNSLYAAKTIEGADPKIKNSLINYLELRAGEGQVSKRVLNALETRAVKDLTSIEIDQVVNQHRAMQTAYALCGVIVAFCLYAAFTPKSILDSTKRAFLADVVRPTNTKLVNIKPGANAELSRVVAGSHVAFSVDVQGVRPEKVKLHYSADGGNFFAVKEFEEGKNYYDPWALTLSNVQQSLIYYITANDAESLRYNLTVIPAPMVTSVAVDLEFPKYTGIPPRTNVEGGNVEAIVGSIITVHAKTNEPARLATLNLTTGAPAPMTVSETDAHELTGKFKVDKTGTYTINFRTTGGQLNPNPVVYDILALPDNQPSARFLRPEQPSVQVPANVPVDLVMTGNDDHGVKDATLHVALGDDEIVSKNVLDGRPPAREFQATETLDLAKLQVQPGAKLLYWLAVRDNREPTANHIETAKQTILVGDPVSEEEKKDIEDQQAKDREELQQPPAQEPQDSDNAVNKQQERQPGESQETDQPNADEQGNTSDQTGQQGGDQGVGEDQRPDIANRRPQDGRAGEDNRAGNAEQSESSESSNEGQPSAEDQQRMQKLKDALEKKGLLDNQPQKPQDQRDGESKAGDRSGSDSSSASSERPRSQDSQPNNGSKTPQPNNGAANQNEPRAEVKQGDRGDAQNQPNNQPESPQPGDRGQQQPGAQQPQPGEAPQSDAKQQQGDAKQQQGAQQGDAKQQQGAQQGDAKQQQQGDAKQQQGAQQDDAKQQQGAQQGDAKQQQQGAQQGDAKQQQGTSKARNKATPSSSKARNRATQSSSRARSKTRPSGKAPSGVIRRARRASRPSRARTPRATASPTTSKAPQGSAIPQSR